MNNGKIAIHLRELFFASFIFLLPLSLYLEVNFKVPYIAYADEILCVICIIYYLYYSYKHPIKGKDLVFVVLLTVLCVIGFLGNFFSKIITSISPIMVDFIALAKLFMPFLVYRQVALYDKDHLMIKYLIPFAKFLILCGSLFGFISLFTDIGMSGSEQRFGLRGFYFVFGYVGGSRYGFILFCCLLILSISKIPLRKYRLYEALVIFNIIIITKGTSFVLAICYIVLIIMWHYSKTYKFTMSNIFIIAVAGTAFSTYQINTYIRNVDSPRMVLIRYGAVTANTYFPFGAGFASYASDQANKNYSPLYYQYGFHRMYGMSPGNRNFLNDGYIGAILGEFGWIGILLFIALIGLIFYHVNKTGFLGKYEKALSFSIFIALVVSTLGTAIIKSSIGVMCLAFLGIVCGYAQFAEAQAEKTDKLTQNNYI